MVFSIFGRILQMNGICEGFFLQWYRCNALTPIGHKHALQIYLFNFFFLIHYWAL